MSRNGFEFLFLLSLLFGVKLEQLCAPLVAAEIGSAATAIADLAPAAFLCFLLILLSLWMLLSAPQRGLRMSCSSLNFALLIRQSLL